MTRRARSEERPSAHEENGGLCWLREKPLHHYRHLAVTTSTALSRAPEPSCCSFLWNGFFPVCGHGGKETLFVVLFFPCAFLDCFRRGMSFVSRGKVFFFEGSTQCLSSIVTCVFLRVQECRFRSAPGSSQLTGCLLVSHPARPHEKEYVTMCEHLLRSCIVA